MYRTINVFKFGNSSFKIQKAESTWECDEILDIFSPVKFEDPVSKSRVIKKTKTLLPLIEQMSWQNPTVENLPFYQLCIETAGKQFDYYRTIISTTLSIEVTNR